MAKKPSKLGTVEEGTIIEFRDGRDLAMAVAFASDRSRLRCVSASGRELVVKEGLLLRVTGARFPAGADRETWAEALRERIDRVAALGADVDLASLWELLEGSDGHELDGLCAEYYGDEPGEDEISAMLWALVGDSVYFKRKGERYQPKERHAVEDTQRQLAERRERQRIRAIALDWARELLVADVGADPPWTSLPEEAREWLTILETVAIGLDKSPLYCRGLSFLAELGRPQTEDEAFSLLVRAGLFSEHENLLLRRHEVSEALPPEVGREVEALRDAAAHPGFEGREDLRHLPVWAIDDADTREIDDGIHIEPRDGGYRLGVHIADVAAWVAPGTALDHEARKRGLTHYMPDRSIPMLPKELAYGAASLAPGEDRLALSLLADFDEALKLVAWRFCRSVVRVHASLTYEEADERIEAEDSPWIELHRLAAQLEAERVERGASRFDRRDCKVRVLDDGEILVKTSRRNGPAQLMVSEAMILANRLAAELCKSSEAVAVFRVQGGARLPDGRLRLERLKVGVHPGPHMGLGIDGYTQATSPLRRYADLCVQRQLVALVEGRPPAMDEEEMTQVVGLSALARVRSEEIEGWANRYWLCRWLEEQGERPLRAKVVELAEDHALVESEDTCMVWRLHPPPGRSFQPNEELWVRCAEIHARSGLVKVAPCGAPEA